ncbi:hypothetical protein HDU93_005185 [Gonapodya sp. JEL0774]|nr:hypothetical protein HDU93_005185 [Gonapodya sp. JEL0774]
MGDSKPTIFILGATGYVGTSVGVHLIAKGYKVWGLARTEEKARDLERRGFYSVRGTLDSPSSWADIAATQDVFIECSQNNSDRSGHAKLVVAAISKITERRRKILGSDGLAKAGKQTVVYTSGTGVYGNALKPGELGNELTVPKAGPYVAFRPALEQDILNSKDYDGVVLRPPLIYGHQGALSSVWFYKFSEARKNGLLEVVLVGNKDYDSPVCHIDDLAEAYVRVVERRRQVRGELFNVINRHHEKFGPLMDAVKRVTGYTGAAVASTESFDPLTPASPRAGKPLSLPEMLPTVLPRRQEAWQAPLVRKGVALSHLREPELQHPPAWEARELDQQDVFVRLPPRPVLGRNGKVAPVDPNTIRWDGAPQKPQLYTGSQNVYADTNNIRNIALPGDYPIQPASPSPEPNSPVSNPTMPHLLDPHSNLYRSNSTPAVPLSRRKGSPDVQRQMMQDLPTAARRRSVSSMTSTQSAHRFLVRRRSQTTQVMFARTFYTPQSETVVEVRSENVDRVRTSVSGVGTSESAPTPDSANQTETPAPAAAVMPPPRPVILGHHRRLSYGSLARRPSSFNRRDLVSTTSSSPETVQKTHQRRRSTSPPPASGSERGNRPDADPEAALQARLRKAKRMKPRGKPREKPVIPDDREDSFRADVDVFFVSRTAQPKWINEGNDAFRKLAVDRRCLQAGTHNCAIYGCSGAGCHAGSPPHIEPRVEELLEIAGRNLERHEKELEMPSKRKSQATNIRRTTNVCKKGFGSSPRGG